MISPLPESSSRSRITPLRVAFAVCLLCVGAGTALHHVMLTDVQKQVTESARAPQVAALENHVAELNGKLREQAQKPVLDVARHEADLKVLETKWEATNQEIIERLAALELSTEERRLLSDLTSLETRIEALEISLSELSDRLPPAAPVPLADEGASGGNGGNGMGGVSGIGISGKGDNEESLPFEVIDVEVRGGAHFVVIDDLAGEPRILYPGDVEKGWRLDGVDEKTAIFRHGETTRRIALPAVQP